MKEKNRIEENKNTKDRLKELRKARKDHIEKIQTMVKEQNKILSSIKSVLKDGPMTPIDLSKTLKLPTYKVMWYLASMKKYGEVVEGEKQGDYYTYLLVKN